MRVMVFVGFIIFWLPLWAMDSSDRELSRVLTDWKKDPKGSAPRLEKVFQDVKNKDTSLRVARLLALTPATQVKVKPAVYAEYFLNYGSCESSSECFSLFRLVGDHYFESSKFAKASTWYEKGIRHEKIDDKDREYLVYKNAWAYLNAKEPLTAYRILSDWLTRNPSAFLREPMFLDLGRIYGEIYFSKLTPLALPTFSAGTGPDKKSFVEGVHKALGRIKPTDDQRYRFYGLMLGADLREEGLPALIGSSIFSKKGPCEVMVIEPLVSAELKKDERWLPTLKACAAVAIESPKFAGNRGLAKLSDWLGQMPSEPMLAWTITKLQMKQGDFPGACESYGSMQAAVFSQKPAWLETWTQEFVDHCAKTATLEQALQNNFDLWKQSGMIEVALASKDIPSSVKIALVKLNPHEKSEVELQALESSLNKTSDLDFLTTLKATCPLPQKGCLAVAMNRLGSAPSHAGLISHVLEAWPVVGQEILSTDFYKQTLITALVVENTLSCPQGSFFKEVDALRTQFQEPQRPVENWSFVSSDDLSHLQAIDQMNTSAAEDDEKIILAIESFQKQATGLSKQSWTAPWAQRLAQTKLAFKAAELQRSAEARGRSAEEKRQWKQVARLMRKWTKQ